MITLVTKKQKKTTKKQGFTLTLGDKVFGKPQGVSN